MEFLKNKVVINQNKHYFLIFGLNFVTFSNTREQLNSVAIFFLELHFMINDSQSYVEEKIDNIALASFFKSPKISGMAYQVLIIFSSVFLLFMFVN